MSSDSVDESSVSDESSEEAVRDQHHQDEESSESCRSNLIDDQAEEVDAEIRIRWKQSFRR
jgi:hypothetical protein